MIPPAISGRLCAFFESADLGAYQDGRRTTVPNVEVLLFERAAVAICYPCEAWLEIRKDEHDPITGARLVADFALAHAHSIEKVNQ